MCIVPIIIFVAVATSAVLKWKTTTHSQRIGKHGEHNVESGQSHQLYRGYSARSENLAWR